MQNIQSVVVAMCIGVRCSRSCDVSVCAAVIVMRNRTVVAQFVVLMQVSVRKDPSLLVYAAVVVAIAQCASLSVIRSGDVSSCAAVVITKRQCTRQS